MEAGKKPHHDHHDIELKAIGAAEAADVDALDSESGAKHEAMEIERGELLTKRGEWQSRVDNPAVPAELEEAVTHASNQVIENGGKLQRETAQLGEVAKELHHAQNEFDACERKLERVLAQVKEAERQVANARAVLHPENGTLLSALRAHPDDQWKRDLARVLNPELLQRTDLDPHALPDGLAENVYGWSLDTRVIEAPGWTDDSVMRESVAKAEANLSSARLAETTQREEHKRRSAAFTGARERHTTLEAQTSVTAAQGECSRTRWSRRGSAFVSRAWAPSVMRSPSSR